MRSILEQTILRTIIYFDLASFPLTKEELFSFLWLPPQVSQGDYLMVLENLIANGTIAQKFGYYFLSGREELIEKRRRQLLATEEKIVVARRAAKKIRSVPFLRAIFVCNTVGSEQSTAESDIDFLIITQSKRIWIVRLLTNLILRFFRLRTYGRQVENRICLSFYLDAHHLSLSNYRIAEDDVHLAYWLYQMMPLYDPDNLYHKFLQANSWSRKYLPNQEREPQLAGRLTVQDSRRGKIWKKIWEKMWGGVYGDLVEKQSRLTQWMKLKPEIKNKVNKGDRGVVISEGIIKFHEHDTRAAYRAEWFKKIGVV